MFDSIYKDIRHSFSHGNMVTRLIIINIAVCIVVNIIKAFSPPTSGVFDLVLQNLAIPGSLSSFMYKPWTLLTSMFLHVSLWHLAMNMLFLYWFGRIVGDLIGDKHILPIYLYGGLVGSIAYIASYYVLGSAVIGSMALGASAATMALVMVAGIIAPDYILRLILIGEVRLKYVVLVIILIDLFAVSGGNNTGGHIAHLGGVLMGYLYIRSLQDRRDLSFSIPKRQEKPQKAKVRMQPVRGKSERVRKSKVEKKALATGDLQEQVDRILEKIKASGYDSLTPEEKETLFLASKSDM